MHVKELSNLGQNKFQENLLSCSHTKKIYFSLLHQYFEGIMQTVVLEINISSNFKVSYYFIF